MQARRQAVFVISARKPSKLALKRRFRQKAAAMPQPKASSQSPLPARQRGKIARALWFCLGVLAVVLGVIGIWLPGLPTTPFIILAAACFARSSDRMHDWLMNHKTFGPMIRDWRERGAISKRAKRLAVLMMLAAWALSFVMGLPTWVLIAQALLLGGSATFILTRPSS